LVHLLSARAVRDFGDGFVAVLLPVYLTMLGFTAFEVGVIATAALLGSALLTLGIGIVGGRHDRRRLLVAGASLMIATGVAFALVHDFALLLVVAFTLVTGRIIKLATDSNLFTGIAVSLTYFLVVNSLVGLLHGPVS